MVVIQRVKFEQPRRFIFTAREKSRNKRTQEIRKEKKQTRILRRQLKKLSILDTKDRNPFNKTIESFSKPNLDVLKSKQSEKEPLADMEF